MQNYADISEFIKALNAKSDSSLTLEKLLERAYDIRKFEIDLYWKRATYFWGFLIASFTAYFLVSDPTKFASKPNYELLVLCIGFLFSLSWYLVNRGSLYWQANWERMIEAIEESLEIEFYKSNLTVPEKVYELPFSWYPYSVGRINIIVSSFICVLWFCLIIFYFSHQANKISFDKPVDFEKLTLVVITVAFSLLLIFRTKFSTTKRKRFQFHKRDFMYEKSVTKEETSANNSGFASPG
jgi:hypothetical protein